jgi:thioredoxin-related protein
MKKLLLLPIILITLTLSAQGYKVNFGVLPEKMQQEPRHILIKIETTWCSICKMQDKQIESNEELKGLLSSKVYYLSFDAETTETINFANNSYRFIPNAKGKGRHELATALGCTDNAYPVWVLLTEDYEIKGTFKGFLKSDALKQILQKL